MSPRTLCLHCFVSGRVQGVFYRGSCAAGAREAGIAGYARNLPDGRVEVLACGEEDAVRAFAEWLWEGSSASRVTDVQVREVPVPDQLPVGFATG